MPDRRPRLFPVGIAFCGFLLLWSLWGCGKTSQPFSSPAQAQHPTPDPLFEDITARAGLRFIHSNGFAGKFYFIESTPAGCALFDYNNDGWLDIFLVQSGSSEPPQQPEAPSTPRPFCALYRNRGDGSFEDVTRGSGLDRDLGYGHGVAVGDYDNDGWEDLFITAYRGNHLFHNERGTGKFSDVTQSMGLGRLHSTGYATSAAFGDYDNDGRLDLYVCYYTPWTWANDRKCADAAGDPEYCTPELYDPDTHRLYRNAGARFIDVSERTGIAKAKGRGLAVVWVDYNEDGKQDLFVANDMTPNFLWRNNGDGSFTEVAAEAGCAYNGDGAVMAGMGIAVADYDHSGRESLYVTDFSQKINALFKNVGGGLFKDVAQTAGRGLTSTRDFLAFGCEFLDYDADGWADLLINNGHVNYRVDRGPSGVTYKERKQLFRNTAGGAFQEVADPALLGDLGRPLIGRGLAVGDIDNDGRLDALCVSQNAPAQLFRNRDRSANHWVAFQTVGTKSNRNGIHARFTLQAGGMRQTATVRGGSSYLSHSDRRVYFGLGKADRIERVEIRWPSGTGDVLRDVKPDAIYIVTEGRRITGRQPAKR